MKSTASTHAHPLHPMIVPFPFAFLTGGWGFGVAAAASRSDDLKTVSRYLVPVGLVAALIAAVPGIVDYLNSVPPKSSAKERATRHALINVSSLALFALGWLAGKKRGRALPLALETAGTAALCVGGWMGGTLVFRNQIGVDHRYANAGKWQEERIDAGDVETAVEEAAHGLQINQMKLVHVKGTRVAVGRTGKGYVAFQDRCTHKGGPLSDGVLMCGTVQCPWHGSQFDVQTGEVKAGPADKNIEIHEIDRRKTIGA